MNQSEAMRAFPIGTHVQFPKADILSSIGSIDDLYGTVLGTVIGYAARVAVIQPDHDKTLMVYVLPEKLFPFPLSG